MKFIPAPKTLGSFFMLITILAFIAGALRNELALTLLGTVFLVILVYCFFGVFFMGLIHRKKGVSLSMTIVRENVNVGRTAELCIKIPGEKSGYGRLKTSFWALPAILVRCELCLKTKDKRVIRHYAIPAPESYSSFPVTERGAYYGEFDRFTVLDAAGLFRLSFPIPQNNAPRLFGLPVPAEEPVPLSLKSGGTEQRSEANYRKSDELTDHRPYVPGDDPRRINWKLYSHAPLGELFVREGEPEPPPHSRLLILIDTEADSSLFGFDESRRAVDLLCENALAAANEFSSRGMDVLIGYTDGKIVGGSESGESSPLDKAELATALAMPAAIKWPKFSGILPPAPNDRAVLVLALPRSCADSSGLDYFLRSRAAPAESAAPNRTDIVFIYNVDGSEPQKARGQRAAEIEEAARTCVNLYNRRPGVHAEKAAVSKTPLLESRGNV